MARLCRFFPAIGHVERHDVTASDKRLGSCGELGDRTGDHDYRGCESAEPVDQRATATPGPPPIKGARLRRMRRRSARTGNPAAVSFPGEIGR